MEEEDDADLHGKRVISFRNERGMRVFFARHDMFFSFLVVQLVVTCALRSVVTYVPWSDWIVILGPGLLLRPSLSVKVFGHVFRPGKL